MTEPVRRSVDANGVNLNVYELGSRTGNSPLVMLHGMRDVGLSLMPIAERLAAEHPVYIMDLRGHGASDKPGNYAMVQFVFDLYCVMTRLVGSPAILFGHSLGGHIVSRFAALYPDLATGAIVVEGLGPPDRRHALDPAQSVRIEGQRLKESLAAPAMQRPLPDVAFAAQRLLANNPRLNPARALELAHQGTERNANGELCWAFDPRVASVFVGLGQGDSAAYWPHVQCPTRIVAGALSAEYWGRAISADNGLDGDAWDGGFAAGELEARVDSFPDADLVLFDNSGHMVHFDEPERLAEVSLDFSRRLS